MGVEKEGRTEEQTIAHTGYFTAMNINTIMNYVKIVMENTHCEKKSINRYFDMQIVVQIDLDFFCRLQNRIVLTK